MNLNNLLNELNPPQLSATLHLEGPLLVLAGAGTGKTKVLTNRIINLIYNNITLPQNILAVTFTNKAANEMYLRIHNKIECTGLNIGTFHSIAAKILRQQIEILELGFNNKFSIVSQEDQIKLIKELLINENISVQQNTPKIIHTLITKWKDLGLFPDQVIESDDFSKISKKIYKKYQDSLLSSNALDFGDIILYNNELFINKPDILNFYQESFKYILIDEYQDTNSVQYIWARMLANKSKNICCVGDDDQSIYSWRGAMVENILRFEKDFANATVIKLEQNYRSSKEILIAASSIINNNKNRHLKTLWTENPLTEKIKIISCIDEKNEAIFIISEIKKLLLTNKYILKNIAILVRGTFQTRILEEILIKNRLDYQIIGNMKFYDRMEIKDLLAYIKISINQNDNFAINRIINKPKRSVGAKTLESIKSYATERQISMFLAIQLMLKNNSFKKRVSIKLNELINNIMNWHNLLKKDTGFNITKTILEESGYLKMLIDNNDEDAQSKIDNINELLQSIATFKTIDEFIEHANLITFDKNNASIDSNNLITLATLHGAKGLEFEIVFLPGWEEGIFPHYKTLNEKSEASLEEERRIAYVGITRAKKKLYISYTKYRKFFYETISSQVSRFLNEIPSEVCTKRTSF